jgi:hypothetical protein
MAAADLAVAPLVAAAQLGADSEEGGLRENDREELLPIQLGARTTTTQCKLWLIHSQLLFTA